MRKTHQREEILAFLRSKRAHFNAVEIYDAVRSEIPNISLGTVYRNLNMLSSEGIIGKLFVGGADRFDYNNQNHYHMLCTKCNRLYDVDMPVDNRLETEAGNYVDGIITTHHLTFIGECESCSH